jgi:hypothetical protein
MKITKTASGKRSVKISKKEWESIGRTAGWVKEAQEEDLEKHFDHYQRGRSDKPMFVSLYETERAYGGPEEGGWWYDINEVKSSQKFFDRDEAEAFLQTIRAKIESQGLNNEDLASSRGMDGYIDPSNGDPMYDHSDADIPLGFSGDARNYWATIEETQGENETTETPHYE